MAHRGIPSLLGEILDGENNLNKERKYAVLYSTKLFWIFRVQNEQLIIIYITVQYVIYIYGFFLFVIYSNLFLRVCLTFYKILPILLLCKCVQWTQYKSIIKTKPLLTSISDSIDISYYILYTLYMILLYLIST